MSLVYDSRAYSWKHTAISLAVTIVWKKIKITI
ncbi:hypothetical protein T07_782 [Trichinella nelsoni]|uniref:Uncharacterized protein n=1 Tax=Trichinella nelsoni TaxID=6336 RepID=A0A0V0RDM5_9BILA|nr:hypothetical protein T07_782 [Trichinella nelsoni]